MKETITALIAILAIIALTIAASSCGGSKRQSAHMGSQIGTPASQTGEHQETTIDSALAELNALSTPDGVDEYTFAQLKSALAEALRSTGATKFTSKPPTGAVNQISDLSIIDDGSGVLMLAWHYRNVGDYNQDGTVGVADISPLAMYFGQHVTDPNTLQGVADGDGNGEIGVTDITPIAMHFASTVASYEVQDAPASSGPWAQMGSLVPFSAGIGPDRLLFEVAIPEGATGYRRVEPLDSYNVAGDASNVVLIPEASEIPQIHSVSPGSGITGDSVQFSAVVDAIGPLTYAWDFSGGATPNLSNEVAPTVLLGAVGNYFASLTVDNPNGSTVFHFILTVTGSGTAPVILGVSPHGGIAGQIIQLHPLISGSQPSTYAWDFGGGAIPSTSNSATPVITLRTAGEYACSLTASNAFGSDTFNFILHVTQSETAPTIHSVFHTAGVTGYLLKLAVDVTGTSPYTYSWDFNGGAIPNTSKSASPEIMLGPVGSYFCTVTVNNDAGSDTFNFILTVTSAGVEPTINSFSPAEGVTGTALSLRADVSGSESITYAWNFGGAGTPNTSHDNMPVIMLGAPGTYLGTLTVTNMAGSDTDAFLITVLAAGEAPVILDVTPHGGQTGSNVTFTSTVLGTSPLSYSWDFGGGASPNTSLAPIPTVTMASPGIYAAMLTVTNDTGTDTLAFDLTVTASGTAPQIISVTPQEGMTGASFTFYSNIDGTAPFNYTWDFGGGATPNTTDFASPTVTLGAAGSYNASLTVTDSFGSDTYYFTLTVTPDSRIPAITSVQPISGVDGTFVVFSAAATGTPVLKYSWDFGGGALPNNSRKPSPRVKLTAPGVHSASVTITNDYGTQTFYFTLTVEP